MIDLYFRLLLIFLLYIILGEKTKYKLFSIHFNLNSFYYNLNILIYPI